MTLNIQCYDEITQKIDKNKTWINTKYKRIISREIKYRTYYCINKRFDNYLNSTEYYLICSDVNYKSKNMSYMSVDDYHRIKIPLNSIWKYIGIDENKSEIQLNISLIECDDTGEIYKLDFQ